MEFDTSFLGFLNDYILLNNKKKIIFDYNDDCFLKYATDNKVFILKNNNDNHLQIDDLEQDIYEDEVKFIYKQGDYIFNPIIYEQIYSFYILHVKMECYVKNDSFKYAILLNMIDDINENVSILKKIRKKCIFKKIIFNNSKKDYNSFLNIDDDEKEKENCIGLLKFLLTDFEIEVFLSGFLFSNEKKSLLSMWTKEKTLKLKIEFLNDKIQEYTTLSNQNIAKIIEKEPLKQIIFKNEGSDIFSFICAKFTKVKNTAFFSYLYFYMKDELKLIVIQSNDSKDYREFVSTIFKLSYTRIQQTTSDNQYKKAEMFTAFNTCKKQYYSEKNE